MDAKELDDVLANAIELNDFKAIPHLIKAGANPNSLSFDNNYTLLGKAVIMDKFKCAEALLKNGADTNFTSKLSGTTPTHTLAFYLYSAGKLMKNPEKWVELFLDYNADFNKNAEKYTSRTPLQLFSTDALDIYEKVVASYTTKQTTKTSKPRL